MCFTPSKTVTKPVLSEQNIELLPPANEVCEGYVFTPVCRSFCSQGGVPRMGQTRYTPRQVHPPRAGTPQGHGHSACWNTVNNRAVRIPLECILILAIK